MEDKKAENLLNNLVLNVVLKELSLKQRREFYELLKSKQYDEAYMFINSNIPDFENKLLNRTKEVFNYE